MNTDTETLKCPDCGGGHEPEQYRCKYCGNFFRSKKFYSEVSNPSGVLVCNYTGENPYRQVTQTALRMKDS